jgi:hypothetical protein
MSERMDTTVVRMAVCEALTLSVKCRGEKAAVDFSLMYGPALTT